MDREDATVFQFVKIKKRNTKPGEFASQALFLVYELQEKFRLTFIYHSGNNIQIY